VARSEAGADGAAPLPILARGVEAAKELARGRAGKQFDPSLADVLCSDADLDGLNASCGTGRRLPRSLVVE
jgi:hypothetical protein